MRGFPASLMLSSLVLGLSFSSLSARADGPDPNSDATVIRDSMYGMVVDLTSNLGPLGATLTGNDAALGQFMHSSANFGTDPDCHISFFNNSRVYTPPTGRVLARSVEVNHQTSLDSSIPPDFRNIDTLNIHFNLDEGLGMVSCTRYGTRARDFTLGDVRRALAGRVNLRNEPTAANWIRSFFAQNEEKRGTAEEAISLRLNPAAPEETPAGTPESPASGGAVLGLERRG